MMNFFATKCMHELMVSLLLELVGLGHHEGGWHTIRCFLRFVHGILVAFFGVKKGRTLATAPLHHDQQSIKYCARLGCLKQIRIFNSSYVKKRGNIVLKAYRRQ